MRNTRLLFNLLNEEVFLFGILNYMCDIVVKRFTFAISSPGERLLIPSNTDNFAFIWVEFNFLDSLLELQRLSRSSSKTLASCSLLIVK